jgi:hypothetical protein
MDAKGILHPMLHCKTLEAIRHPSHMGDWGRSRRKSQFTTRNSLATENASVKPTNIETKNGYG